MIYRTLLISSILVVTSSCGLLFSEKKASTEDPRIISAAEARINNYVRGKLSSCRNRVLVDAETYVDTTLAKKIDELLLLETDGFPARPERPDVPDKLSIDGDFKPTPIFQDTIKRIDKNLIPNIKSIQIEPTGKDSL